MTMYSSESGERDSIENERKTINWAVSVIHQGIMFIIVGVFISISADMINGVGFIVELNSIVRTAGVVFSVLYAAVGLLIILTGLAQLIISGISDPNVTKDVLSDTRAGGYVVSVVHWLR